MHTYFQQHGGGAILPHHDSVIRHHCRVFAQILCCSSYFHRRHYDFLTWSVELIVTDDGLILLSICSIHCIHQILLAIFH